MAGKTDAKIPKTPGPAKPDIAVRAQAWLPFVAGVLCLSLIAIAVISLFDVNAEPESPASAKVTSVAAEGYAGLRRLLEAQGARVRLNRFEDGNKDVDRGDLEIITLDDDAGVFSGDIDSAGDKASASASAGDTSSADATTSDSAADSSSASADSATRNRLRRLMRGVGQGDGYAVPDTRRVDHVLHHPLGRAVLVVAPKWTVTAASGPQARWGSGAEVMAPGDVGNILAVLAPVTWKPVPPVAIRPVVVPRTAVPRAAASSSSDDDDTGDAADAPTAMLDRVPYLITRAPGVRDAVLTPTGQGPIEAPFATGKIDRLQSVTGPNLVPVLTGPNGQVLLSRVIVGGNRPQTAVPVYLLSDPDLLNNQVLADPARTVTALNLIKALTPPSLEHQAKARPSYVFNLTFNALGFDHDLLHALSRPPYIGVPLALALAALGLVWAAFARFGPARIEEVRPALGRGVRILADNAARLMAVTLKEARLGPAYAQMIRDQVLKIRGYRQIDARESADDLADRISQIYKATHTYGDLRTQAARVVTVHQLIDVALRLHTWKTEIAKAEIGPKQAGQNKAGKTETHLANR